MVRIATDWRTATLDEQEFAILEFAEKLTLTPSLIDEEDIKRLQHTGLTERQIFAAVQAICYRNFISRIADSLGVEPEDSGTMADEIMDAFRSKRPQPPRAQGADRG